MRTEATLEQWKELYDITIKIKELKPWNHLWDMDIITVQLPNRNEPCFFSVMGRGGTCFGISTYVDYDGLNDFYDIADTEDNGIPIDYLMLEQNTLTCYFCDRDELEEKQYEIIRALGYRFRGNNQWIDFTSYKKGFMPYQLDGEEVVLLTEAYQQLHMALRAYIEQGLQVDFEKGQTLMRHFSQEKDQWLSYGAPLQCPQREYPEIELEDDILKAKIRKMNILPIQFELDMIYMNQGLTDEEFGRPINPKLLMMMDRENGIAVAQQLLKPGMDPVQAVFGICTDFMLQHGKMRTLFVRNPFIYSVLAETCRECGIDLAQTKELPVVDAFAHELRSYMGDR